MSNELNLKKQIEEWGKEYDVNCEYVEPTYTWISKNTMGLTSFRVKPDTKLRGCFIKITDVFIDYPFASKSVLWHEFCHAEVWIKEGKTEGHNDKWNGRLWRKPLLALSDYIYTNILFLFVRHK